MPIARLSPSYGFVSVIRLPPAGNPTGSISSCAISRRLSLSAGRLAAVGDASTFFVDVGACGACAALDSSPHALVTETAKINSDSSARDRSCMRPPLPVPLSLPAGGAVREQLQREYEEHAAPARPPREVGKVLPRSRTSYGRFAATSPAMSIPMSPPSPA